MVVLRLVFELSLLFVLIEATDPVLMSLLLKKLELLFKVLLGIHANVSRIVFDVRESSLLVNWLLTDKQSNRVRLIWVCSAIELIPVASVGLVVLV